MPVRIDEIEATIEPDQPRAETEATTSSAQNKPDLREVQQQLRQIEQRAARLRTD